MLRYFLTYLILLFVFTACSSEDPAAREVEAPPSIEEVFGAEQKGQEPSRLPLPEANIPLQDFQWLAQEGKRFSLANGTTIDIPAAAVVDAEGEQVNGLVTLSYREFHGVEDVFLSGLRMRTSENGQDAVLRSAGMMEIRAHKNGEELYMAPGKEIRVSMASYTQGAYNLYHYDEQAEHWDFFLSRNEVKQSNQGTANLPPLPPRPIKPKKLDRKDIIFNFDIPYDDFEELQTYMLVFWKFAGVTRAGSLDPREDKWLTRERWRAARLSRIDARKGLYMLNLENEERSAKVVVTPVLEGGAYEDAMVQYLQEQQEYDQAKAERQAQAAKVAAKAQLLRKCPVGTFGYYNWDLPMPESDFASTEADFRVQGIQTFQEENPIEQVYLLLPEHNTVLAFPKKQWSTFRYLKRGKNCLLARNAAGEWFWAGDQSLRKARGKAHFTFTLQPVQAPLTSSQDIKDLFASL
jgi:hypothetical protein